MGVFVHYAAHGLLAKTPLDAKRAVLLGYQCTSCRYRAEDKNVTNEKLKSKKCPKCSKPLKKWYSGFHNDSSLSSELRKKIAFLGLVHRAGNVYECPSTQDFWKVQGNSIKKLVGDEVDNGEQIDAAPEDRPLQFIESILDELEF